MRKKTQENKLIIKNTLILYIRMFFMMFISFFTSRLVLQTLGVEDYGINNVVGGFLSMFSVVTTSMSNAISRFITFELGKGNFSRMRSIFSLSINIQVFMGILIVVLLETIGIWFLDYKLNIPQERLEAASFVFHCSVLSSFIGLISVPYHASIVAHEKMNIFAYMSILEVILKLLAVLTLYISPYDKLKTFAITLLFISIIMRIIYSIYCTRTFKECRYKFIYDKKLIKEMTGFASWNFVGEGIFILNSHGLNILINIFYGVTLNAARGIAGQINQAVNTFVGNFTTALTPQITKSYSQNDLARTQMLICKGAKYSYYLMLFFTIPIFIETQTILHFWLGIVPEYSISFTRWTFVNSALTLLGQTLIKAQFATGEIKKYQIIVTSICIFIFPLTYISLKLWNIPEFIYIIYFIVYFLLLFVRMLILARPLKMNCMLYFRGVLLKVFIVTIIAIIPPFIIQFIQEPSFLRLLEVCLISIISTALTIYIFGIDKEEKKYINNKMIEIRCYIKKLKGR